MKQPRMKLADVMKLRLETYTKLEKKLNQLPLEVVNELATTLDVTEQLVVQGNKARFELHFVRKGDDDTPS